MTRTEVFQLIESYIEQPSLRNHCFMVAQAMHFYANKLGLSEEEQHEWWTAGALHDLDWEKFPDEHPNKAVNDIFPQFSISEEVIQAIKAHAPERTGVQPSTTIDKYLFACDEISGFMHAVSLMRPTGFDGMKPKSVTKKLKDQRFAAAVSREDIAKGAAYIGLELNEHLANLIECFSNPKEH